MRRSPCSESRSARPSSSRRCPKSSRRNIRSTNVQARTCVVADDHPSVLRTVTELVRVWGWTVAGSATNGAEALEKIEHLRPAVAVVDLSLPRASGFEIIRGAAKVSPGTAMVVYSGLNDPESVRRALDAGARGYVVKEAPLEGLRRALDTVIEGGRYVDPVASASLLLEEDTAVLTERERQVLSLLANGSSYEEVGRELFISSETVRTHVAKSLRKLGARTRTHAVAEALRAGLIS